MHFGENQLSPCSIGISPHPQFIEPFSMDTGAGLHERYPRFTLTMGRSRGFGSAPANLRPIQTRFPFGSATEWLNLPARATRRFIMQKARHRAATEVA